MDGTQIFRGTISLKFSNSNMIPISKHFMLKIKITLGTFIHEFLTIMLTHGIYG